MSRRKRPPAAPTRGEAGAGAVFDPAASDACADMPPGPSGAVERAMPAPQTPLPDAEFERLKARAVRSRAVPPVPAQADPGVEPRHPPRKPP